MAFFYEFIPRWHYGKLAVMQGLNHHVEISVLSRVDIIAIEGVTFGSVGSQTMDTKIFMATCTTVPLTIKTAETSLQSVQALP